MRPADVVEIVDKAERRGDVAAVDQAEDGLALREIGVVGPLESLLPHPQVTEVQVSHSSTAGDDHATCGTAEDRGRQCVRAEMLEHNARRAPLIERRPECPPEVAQPARIFADTSQSSADQMWAGRRPLSRPPQDPARPVRCSATFLADPSS